MTLVIETTPAQGAQSRTPLRAGTIRLNVRPGDVFRLMDEATGKAPPKAIIKQLDSSILIEIPAGAVPGASATRVELLDFYRSCSVSAPCHLQLPAADGMVDITPATAAIGALSDGSFVLHDPAGYSGYQQDGADAAGHNSFAANKPLMYGLGAAAVVGLVAAAASGGSSGDGNPAPAPGSNSGTAPGTAPGPAPGPAPDAQPVPQPPASSTDPSFSITQSSVGTRRAPILAGTGTAGSDIRIDIDTNGDSATNVSFLTKVGADGRWMADLSKLAPSSGALPAAGLNADSAVRLTQTGSTGSSTLPVFKLTADNTPPAAPTLAAVANDNIINQAEATGAIRLSGQGEAASLIKLNWGKASFDTTVSAAGTWQVEVPAAALPPDGKPLISITASDYAGNTAPAVTQAITIDRTPPSAPLIQHTAGNNNYLNATEHPGGAAISGTAEAGSLVEVRLAGATQTAQADAQGKWQLLFPTSQLPGADGQHEVIAMATDPAGNPSPASPVVPLHIDTLAPALDDIHVGSSDTVRSATPFVVSGQAEGGASIIVDYIYSHGGERSITTQQFIAPGKAGETVEWTSPSFTTPAVNNNAFHSLLVSASDVAGNIVTRQHTFLVRPPLRAFRSLQDEARQPEDNPVLNAGDLFDDNRDSPFAQAASSGLPAPSLPMAEAAAAGSPSDGVLTIRPVAGPDSLLQTGTDEWLVY